jgi:4-hydroxy-4-methyl-2-oxoglutarate aldolase
LITVHKRGGSIPNDLLTRAGRIAPASIGHLRERGFMDPQIELRTGSVRLVGPALTVRLVAPHGGAVHMAIDAAQPGDIIVVDTGGNRTHACWGDGTTIAAKARGVAGVIIDGVATDVQDLRRLGFPVYCRGLSVLTTKATYEDGEVNGRIVCGGTPVAPGDLVLADDNGVAVIPQAEVEPVVRDAERFEEHERAIHARLAAGESLVEIVRELRTRSERSDQ